jgi:hypothetical protein
MSKASSSAPRARWVSVENRTARQIALVARHGTATHLFGPFETHELQREDLERLDYQEWLRRNYIRIHEQRAREELDPRVRPLAALGAFAAAQVRRLGTLLRMAFSSLTFLLVMLIGFGLPFIPLALSLQGAGAGAEDIQFTRGDFLQVLLWLFVGLASVLPAMMYFLFYRVAARTLREAFLREIVQINPSVDTIDDAENLFGARLDDVYGNLDAPRSLIGTHLPILVSTILITMGWLIVLPPFGTTGSGDGSLLPRATPTSFGFLGAYFYVLNMVFRRYVRSDLGPKAYNHISFRLVTTMVLVQVLNLLPLTASGDGQPASTGVLVFAFFAGIVPETALVAIQDFLKSSRMLQQRMPSLQEQCPLTELEGITLYDRARLLEEGIENVENLAHHNLVDLMLWTRIPTERLLDLLDQAILYLHVGRPRPAQGDGEGFPVRDDLETLRRYGIRTATDLIRAYESAQREGREAAEALLSLLDDEPGPRVPHRLGVILSTLLDDAWLGWLRHWLRRMELGQTALRLEDLDRRREAPPLVALERHPPEPQALAS